MPKLHILTDGQIVMTTDLTEEHFTVGRADDQLGRADRSEPSAPPPTAAPPRPCARRRRARAAPLTRSGPARRRPCRAEACSAIASDCWHRPIGTARRQTRFDFGSALA